MPDVKPHLDELRAAMRVASRAKAQMERAEENRKIVFSEEVVASQEKSLARAEHIARASSTYQDAVEELKQASIACGDAQAEVVYLQNRFEAWRTNMASARANRMTGDRHASTKADNQGR